MLKEWDRIWGPMEVEMKFIREKEAEWGGEIITWVVKEVHHP